ncbi:MAG: glycosyltransferase involved in cell wall biosynthesis [Cellvibrionaceae bacterium]|jgi:glycosyltransferase involved in cell wall biosynthesis
MRILIVSKACLTGTYQSKLSAIGATTGIDLAVMVPPTWDDPAGQIVLEKRHTDGYQLMVEPLRFNGNYHFHYWPTLRQRIAEFKPDIVHMDEEPYNLATWLAWRAAKKAEAKFLFFSWQNLCRQYPQPFRWMEQQVLKNSDFGIMGNQEAVEVFKQKGYLGPQAVIPQFGTDPTLFTPAEQMPKLGKIGFAGRLIHGKGIDLLIQAAAKLPKDDSWSLHIAGDGPEDDKLKALAQELGIAKKVNFSGRMGSADVPTFLQSLDMLVLPSRTLPNWKEQFGRILVEAMACGLPVIGSNSGEIPNVIGDAGLVFPEENVEILAAQIEILLNDEQKRDTLGKIGRERVIANFTQQQIAAATVAVYRQILD